MSNLPLFKTEQGEEIDQLKARVLELEAFAHHYIMKWHTEDAAHFADMAEDVLDRTPAQFLLLHDAEVLEDCERLLRALFGSRHWIDPEDMLCRMLYEANKLRQQAEGEVI